jgi:hypothetical protein
MRVRVVVAAAVVSCAMLAVGCSGSPNEQTSSNVVESSGPSFFSVQELAEQSTSIFLATIGPKVSTQRDNGGNAADVEGVPIAIFELRIERVLGGSDPGSSPVGLITVDQDVWPGSHFQSQPRRGDRVVLFVEEVRQEAAPGLTLALPTFRALGGDNGVFDVTGERARARANVFSIDRRPITDIPARGKGPLLDVPILEVETAVSRMKLRK